MKERSVRELLAGLRGDLQAARVLYRQATDHEGRDWIRAEAQRIQGEILMLEELEEERRRAEKATS